MLNAGIFWDNLHINQFLSSSGNFSFFSDNFAPNVEVLSIL